MQEPQERNARLPALILGALVRYLEEAQAAPPRRAWREGVWVEPTPGSPWRAWAWTRQKRPRSARRWWLPSP